MIRRMQLLGSEERPSAPRLTALAERFRDGLLRDNKVIPAVLGVLALLVFAWIVAGAFVGGPGEEEDQQASNQASLAQPDEPDSDSGGPETPAPGVENRDTDSYSEFGEPQDPFYPRSEFEELFSEDGNGGDNGGNENGNGGDNGGNENGNGGNGNRNGGNGDGDNAGSRNNGGGGANRGDDNEDDEDDEDFIEQESRPGSTPPISPGDDAGDDPGGDDPGGAPDDGGVGGGEPGGPGAGEPGPGGGQGLFDSGGGQGLFDSGGDLPVPGP